MKKIHGKVPTVFLKNVFITPKTTHLSVVSNIYDVTLDVALSIADIISLPLLLVLGQCSLLADQELHNDIVKGSLLTPDSSLDIM